MRKPSSVDGPSYPDHPDFAIAALIRMLVRFPLVRCAALSGAIEEHLDLVARDPRLPELIRQAALVSQRDWSEVIESATELEMQQVRFLN